MKSRALLFFLLFFSLQLAGLSIAFSADTPSLTWERGREQTITLGGDTASKLWKLILVDSAGASLPFIRSSANSAGFYIYSIDLADGLNEGNYQIMTQGPDLRVSLVANVVVVPITNYNPLQDPRGVGALAVVAFTLLSLFSGTSKPDEESNDPNNSDGSDGESADDAALGSVDAEFEETGSAGGRDRWGYGAWGIVKSLDYLRFFATSSTSKKSRLMTRIIADGAYFQSLFGPLTLILPMAAIVLGLSLGMSSDLATSLVPTSVGLLLAIIIIGIFDSLSGAIAILTFALTALVQGLVNTLTDLRTVLALSFIAFTPILIASAMRPPRRAALQWSPWKQTSDVVIASLLTGWAVKSMILALDGFSHQKNPIAAQSNFFGLVAGVAIAVRYLLEGFSLRYVRARLAFLTPPAPPLDSMNRLLMNLTTKAGLFLLFTSGFFGLNWQIFMAATILLLPTYLARYSYRFPNLPVLFKLIPTGLPGLIFLTLTGIALSHWVNSLLLLTSDKTKTMVVILSLPAFIHSLLRLFGRYPARQVSI